MVNAFLGCAIATYGLVDDWGRVCQNAARKDKSASRDRVDKVQEIRRSYKHKKIQVYRKLLL